MEVAEKSVLNRFFFAIFLVEKSSLKWKSRKNQFKFFGGGHIFGEKVQFKMEVEEEIILK